MQLFFPTHRPPILTLDPKVILDAARDTLAFINREAIAQLVLLPISFLIIFRQRLSDMRIKILLVALVMVPILTFLLFVGRPTFYYLILITPLFDLVVGVMLSKILWHEMLGNRLLKPVVALIYGIVLICYLPFTLLIFQYDHWPPYVSTMSHVQSYIRSGDRIMGDQIFWFGLYDHHYDCWEELTYFHHLYPDSTLEVALAYFKPDIFILDSKVLEFINEKPKDDILYKNLWIPVDELKEALDRHGTEVTRIESNLYDEVYVYRLSW